MEKRIQDSMVTISFRGHVAAFFVCAFAHEVLAGTFVSEITFQTPSKL
jgi:hypothetical protein